MKLVDELKKLGVEITPEIEKKFDGEFISVKEHEKKLSKVEAERDNLKERAESAETTLKEFEGKDFEQMQGEVEKWKAKAEQAEKDYAEKLSAREKADLLSAAMAEIQFTSESAKKSIMAEIEKDISVKDGALIGFGDLIAKAKEKDASAFVDTEKQKLEEKKVTWTRKMNESPEGSKITREEIAKIKNPEDRRRAIAENLDLFRKGE